MMKISLEQRVKLIESHPFFILLQRKDIIELANNMEEYQFTKLDVLVKEGELVDYIYLIVTGQAQATRRSTSHHKSTELPLAILNKGEAVGISEEGFFPNDGKYSATVVALTDMSLLRINIIALSYFFEHPKRLYPGFKEASLSLLRTHFIMQSCPFDAMKYEDVLWLIQKSKTRFFPAGTIIFSKGNITDKCYLIESGQVEMSVPYGDATYIVAILSPPAMFGGRSLMMNLSQDETAIAIQDCYLLEISRHLVQKILSNDKALLQKLMRMIHMTSKPKQTNDILEINEVGQNGKSVTVLQKNQPLQVFTLKKEGLFIWHQINGKNTINKIMRLYRQRFGHNDEYVYLLITELTKAGFVLFPEYYHPAVVQNSILAKLILWLRKK